MKRIISIVSLCVCLGLLNGCSFFEGLLGSIGIGDSSDDDDQNFVSPYDEPQVLCAYFHYFRSDNMAQWHYPGHDPENIIGPEPWRRDIWIGRTGDYPYIGIYNNVTDSEIMRWHIRLAKSSGISAFLLYVYNWEEQRRETQLILDIAAQENFKIGFVEHHSYLGAVPRAIFEGRPYPIMSRKYVGYDQIMKSYAEKLGLPLPEEQTRYLRPSPRSLRAVPPDAVKQASERIASMINTWKDHPAYYRVDGKPIILIPYADEDLEPADFKQIAESIEAEVGQDLYIVAIVPQVYWYFYPPHIPHSGITQEWANAGADSFTHWTPNGMITASQKLRENVTKFNVEDSVKWKKDPMIPVMPGFDDDAWNPGDNPAPSAPRQNGEAWRAQLEAAVQAKPRFIFIQAWNEWHEGSQIEPSTYYSDPYLYLQILTKELGRVWQTPPLPPRRNVDPLREKYLPYD